MKPASAAAVFHRLRPSERKLQQEPLDRQYATDAVKTLSVASRRRRMPKVWTEQQWTEPHLVAILEQPGFYLRQVTVARVDHRPLQRLRNRGAVVDTVEVPTRFHATLLVSAVLEVVDQWRVQAAPKAFAQGHAHCWVDDADQIDLMRLAETVTNGGG